MKYFMLILLFVGAFLSSETLKSQDSTRNKIRLGLSASYEKNTSSESIPFNDFNGFSAEYDQFNYRFGLDLEFFFNDNLTINTAVKYSNKDLTGTYFCAFCDFILPYTSGASEFNFIEVPITIKYYFLPAKIRLFTEAGLNNIFSLNDLEFDGRTDSFTVGLKIGGGVEYNLNQQLAVQVKIDYNTSITGVLKDSDFNIQSLNIGFGILKRL